MGKKNFGSRQMSVENYVLRLPVPPISETNQTKSGIKDCLGMCVLPHSGIR